MSDNTLEVIDAVVQEIHDLAEKGDGPATRAEVMAVLGLVLDLSVATRLDAIAAKTEQVQAELKRLETESAQLNAGKDRVKYLLDAAIADRLAELRTELRGRPNV